MFATASEPANGKYLTVFASRDGEISAGGQEISLSRLAGDEERREKAVLLRLEPTSAS